jgi:hypothetical protein
MSDQIGETTSTALNGSVPFDFISSEDLRKSLENDYAELTKAISADMWKSACILAGSIAEAALLDYVETLGNCAASEEELTSKNVGLSQLIDAAIGIDVLARSQPPAAGWSLVKLRESGAEARKSRSSDAVRMSYLMSSAVENFRNLIHPGRSLRLKEHVDKSTAEAARAFVDRLLQDLGRESADRYPYMAEDLLEKAQEDTDAQTILLNMLRKTRPTEITRLLVDIAPNAFLKDLRRLEELEKNSPGRDGAWDNTDIRDYDESRRSAETSRRRDAFIYQLTFDYSDQVQRQASLHAIAEMLKTGSSYRIAALETELLRMSDLRFATDEDQKLLVGDVLDRVCSTSATEALLKSAAGIGQWIPPESGRRFADALLNKEFQPRVDSGVKQAAFSLLENEYENMSKPTQEVVRKATNTYRNSTAAFTKNSKEDVQAIDDLVAYWDAYWDSLPYLVDFDDSPHPPSR